MEVIAGVMYHAVGASSAALCYTPQKKALGWSWQTYWLAQAAVCWLLLPVIVAWLTIPQLGEVLREAPTAVMGSTFLLGMAYGVGGTAFGMAIRYVGFSLTYAISVGISCVLGTLIPPLVRGELGSVFDKTGAGWVMTGIALGALGIAVCGVAGRSKEKDLERNDAVNSSFSLRKGLPLCLLAGVLSAVYGFSLDQGKPIADIAARYGAGSFQGNVVYIFSNSGAFVTTLLYCLYLHKKQGTFGEYSRVPAGEKATGLPLNFAMAALTGLLWYGQFFFYGLGHVRMGNYKFSSWAIHMIMLVLFSTVAGILLREWSTSSKATKLKLGLALAVLTIAVIVLTYGNYLGGEAGTH
ncbi:L-rhamnose/proton symporter RhaT [Paraflavitalea pollutisoli]|uniref:L-rhamnose/proton symporter RhaT n=1 Tax=Paraflavitalea pollutisoli TaxID=3034143 RepID=UPI0023EAB2DA|nr:L-rhamnose/proton symporter RhaT [Paraflavitalea sp. H1-2-19X]